MATSKNKSTVKTVTTGLNKLAFRRLKKLERKTYKLVHNLHRSSRVNFTVPIASVFKYLSIVFSPFITQTKKKKKQLVNRVLRSGNRLFPLVQKKLALKVRTLRKQRIVSNIQFALHWAYPNSLLQLSKSRLQQVTSLYFSTLLVTGTLFIGAGIFIHLYNQTVLSFKAVPVLVGTTHLQTTYPVLITIESAHINTQVTTTTIIDGIWQISPDKAGFLETSATPLENGNTIIYGHNKRGIFQSLHLTKVGDKVKITTAGNIMLEYQVKEIKVVDPEDIEVVAPTDYHVLTIYTCTGLLDSKRLVIKAYPVGIAAL